MAKKHPRKRLGNWVFLIAIALIAIMGIFDAMNMTSWHEVEDEDRYDIYNKYSQWAQIGLWITVFVGMSIMYYLFSKDISESIGLFASGLIMLLFGVLDIFFFLLSKYQMTAQMCWFNEYGSLIGILSETFTKHSCVTPTDLWVIAIIGTILAFIVFRISLYIRPIRK